MEFCDKHYDEIADETLLKLILS